MRPRGGGAKKARSESRDAGEARRARLWAEAAEGNAGARAELLESQAGTIRRLAAERATDSMTREDLAQEGALGVLDAIASFREGADDFDDVAKARAAAHMDAALAAEAAADRESQAIVQAAEDYDRVQHRLAAELHRQPTDLEIARKLEWSRERVESVGRLVEDARRRHDEELLEYLDPATDVEDLVFGADGAADGDATGDARNGSNGSHGSNGSNGHHGGRPGRNRDLS